MERNDREQERCWHPAVEVERLRETLREVLGAFCRSDAGRSWWLRAGRVDLEDMRRWRAVAGLEEGEE